MESKILDFVQSASSRDVDRYNTLMANNGPYQKILKHTSQDQGTRLKEIEEEFNPYNTQRDDLENAVKKKKQSLDNLSWK